MSNSDPNWAEALSSIAAALTLVAIVIGAAVGYVRFLKGRVYHAKCDLELGVEALSVCASKALRITVGARNGGTLRLDFPEDTGIWIQVSHADEAAWKDAKESTGEILWSRNTFHSQELLTVEDQRQQGFYLEPGQRVVRCVLIPTDDQVQAVAYRIQAIVRAEPQRLLTVHPVQEWSTEQVLVMGPRLNGQTATSGGGHDR